MEKIRTAGTSPTATHALRIVFGGVFERFPRVRLIRGTWARHCRSSCGALISEPARSLIMLPR